MLSETIEHAPPKIMFVNSHRPQGIEVPSCKRCNNGSSQQDQVAAFFSLLFAEKLMHENSAHSDEYNSLLKVLKGLANNNPDLAGCIKHRGDEPIKFGGKLQMMPKFTIEPVIFEKYLDLWAAKQVLAYWYELTGTSASDQTGILIRWVTLYELSNDPELVQFANDLPGIRSLFQGKWDTAQQFFVKDSINSNEKIGMFFFAYHSGVSFIAIFDDSGKSYKIPNGLKATCSLVKTNATSGIHLLK